MNFKNVLIIVGVSAIPLWYAYRTVSDARVKKLEWNEIFMTEASRQKKRAEDRVAADKKVEEDRIAASTERDRAAAARKIAEAQAADAEKQAADARAAALQKELEKSTQAQQAEQEIIRRRSQADIARIQTEAAAVTRQKELNAKLQVCVELASAAQVALQDLKRAQSNFKNATEELAKVPTPTERKWPTYSGEHEFSRTFRMLINRSPVSVGNLDEIREERLACEQEARSSMLSETGNYASTLQRDLLKATIRMYRGNIDSLATTLRDLRDLVDWANQMLPNTVSGRVSVSRVEDLIRQSADWKGN